MIKKGYKIVNPLTQSAVIGGHAKVQYAVGKKAYPHIGCGPLCVFDTLEHARDWALYSIIYKCEFKKSKETEVWNKLFRDSFNVLPVGTILADWVKLIREV